MSVYNNERRLDTALKNLNEIDITKQNKTDIRTYLHFLSAQGISIARQCKYIYPLKNIARWLNKDFSKATKEDIVRICSNIENNKDYTAWTKQDYKVTIKKFYKWLYNRNKDDIDEWEYPKIVKFIKIRKPKESRKIPSDLLKPKDIEFLANHARNLREKALILTLYESGARIGEILNLKVKDVTFDDYGAQLNLFGKTGYRKIRIVGSSPAISTEGTIYVGVNIYDGGGDIIAVNPDGTEKWRKRIATYWVDSSPCIGEDGTVYIGSTFNQGKGYLHAFGSVESNEPPEMPTITGTINGKTREEYFYYFTSTDPDNNPVSFYVDWGDGTINEWDIEGASGESVWVKRAYAHRGIYTIKAKAKDTLGEESNWATLEVSMPKNKATDINSLLLRFLENHPYMFPILRHSLELFFASLH